MAFPLDKDNVEVPNVVNLIQEDKIDLVINLPNQERSSLLLKLPYFTNVNIQYSKQLNNNYLIRRTAVDFNVPLITNISLVKLFVESISYQKENSLPAVNAGTCFVK